MGGAAGALQACLEQKIPFSKCHRRASSGALMNGRFNMCDIKNYQVFWSIALHYIATLLSQVLHHEVHALLQALIAWSVACFIKAYSSETQYATK